MIHSALPGRVSHWHIPQTQILAMHIHWGWRKTVCLCSGMILPYIRGCKKLFSSNSPRSELDIPWGSTQILCRAATPIQGPTWSVQPTPPPLPGGFTSLLHPMRICDGWELGMPRERLYWQLFPFFNPIWMSSFAAFLHISCGMSICYRSGLLIRVSGRGRSNGLQEPKYVTATLLSLSTKIRNLHEKLEQAALTSPILHMPHEQDPNYFTFL